MKLGIQQLVDEVKSKKKDMLLILEYYPASEKDEDMVGVPMTRLKHEAGGCVAMLNFEDVEATHATVGKNSDILEKDEYLKEVKQLVKQLKSEGNIELYFDENTMYQRYKSVSEMMSIYNVVDVMHGESLVSISKLPVYTPEEGRDKRVSFEAYMKSLQLVMPNISNDLYTVTEMYKVYYEGMPKGSSYAPVSMVASTTLYSIQTLVSDIMDEVDLTTKSIKRMLTEDDILSGSEVDSFVKLMSSRHGICKTEALGLILYSLPAMYKGHYALNNIEDSMDTQEIFIYTKVSKRKKIKDIQQIV